MNEPVAEQGHAETESAVLGRILDETLHAGGELPAGLAPFIDELTQRAAEHPAEVEALLSAWIADIDELLTAQTNELIHAPEFQRLESSWRGLRYLVSQSDTGPLLRIRVLHASKDDLRKDLDAASEFDQSALFVKVYEEEYGMFGGEPFGALIGDYEFTNHPQDIALLERISNVAAAAHAPFIGGVSPALFGWESFTELQVPRNLARIFDSPEYVKWRAFRDSEDSRYVGLTLPRVLVRAPYRPETDPVESFNFREDVDATDAEKHLWGNAAYAFGARLADAFARSGWCARIRGLDGGGLVDGLPSPAFPTDARGLAVRGPTEVAITDPREKELADLGFIPLVQCQGTGSAVFYSTQSCQKPRRYDTDEANANARLSTQLHYILGTSRFAHYLKVLMRDKLGAVTTPHECEDFLGRWLTSYCLGNPDSADPETKARRPLRDARVTVREVRGKPGYYEAVVHLQPHFQLDELTVALRLVTELPPPAQGG
jgi:type VI secretion system protein ImpC